MTHPQPAGDERAALRLYDALTRILGLAQLQRAAIESVRINDFVQLMYEREQLVADAVDNANAALTDATAGLGATIQHVLGQVLQQDGENQLLIEHRMEAVKAELSLLRQDAATVHGYASALLPGTAAVLIDTTV